MQTAGGLLVLPDAMPVWRVELDPRSADRLRREVGSDRRAAVEELDWQSEWGDPVPPDAVLLRVEPDAPVGVFVEKWWPQADYGYRREQIRRLLRETEPVAPPKGYEGPVLLGHVVAFALKHGIPLWRDPEEAA
jgi:hypothetical protein